MHDESRYLRGSDPEAPHLFPSPNFGPYYLSAQADVAGYDCRPRMRMRDLRDYEAVEVKLSGPEGKGLDPAAVGGFSPRVLACFKGEPRCIGGKVPVDLLPEIEARLKELAAAYVEGAELPDPGPRADVSFTEAEIRAILARIDPDDAGPEDEAIRTRLLEAAEAAGFDVGKASAPRP